MMFLAAAQSDLRTFLRASLTLGLLFGVISLARGREVTPLDPATVDEAAKILNLETFPLLDGAEAPGLRRMASLSYTAKADVRKAYEFQKEALAVKGWKELPNPYLAAESASGTFVKDGFIASVSVFPGDARKPGTVRVSINQLGNVDLAKLPVPAGAKPAYAGPVIAMFVTEAARGATASACRELLIARGWQPYGTAGDSLIFKQNAVRLNARISTAPAQGGKTAIQYSADLLSADLPAPPDSVRAQYADTTTTLSFDAQSTPGALVDYYREALGKAGWKSTTEQTIKTGVHEMLIFRNPQRDMLTLEFFPSANLLRGTLKHQSAAEIDQLEQLAKQEAAPKKAAPRPLPKARPTVTIALPAEAEDVKEKYGNLEFTVSAGRAKPIVESLRKTLRQAGWKQDVAALEEVAGAVSLSKEKGGSLTINYTDTGVTPARITITAIGVVVEKAKADEK